jgi:hypothetical protein
MSKFSYGMKYRPLGIGCQPKGHIDYLDSYDDKLKQKTEFYGIVSYDRKLTAQEIYEFELKELN